MKTTVFIVAPLLALAIVTPRVAGAFGIQMSARPSRAEVPATVHFTCLPKGGEPPFLYTWNFHDLESYKNPSYEQNPDHVFHWPGHYQVEVTVTDDTGETATAMMPVTISLGGEVVNAVDYLEMKNDGITDNGTILADFLQANPDRKIIVEFPAGSYLFRQTQSFSKPDAVTFRPTPVNASVTFLFNPKAPRDGKHDYLFVNPLKPSHITYVHNITFQKKIGKTQACELDHSELFKQQQGNERGLLVLEQCNVMDFNTVSHNNRTQYYKNNIIDWGCRAISIYSQEETLIENNYIKSRYPHSHVIYSGANRPNVFIVGNYLDATNMYKAQHVLNFYATRGRVVEHKYAFNNILKSDGGHCVSMEGQDTRIDPRHIHITNNIFDGCPNGVYLTTTSEDIVIRQNHFQNIKGHILTVGEDNGAPVRDVLFIHNTLGLNAGTDGGGTLNLLSGTCKNELSACGIWQPNTDDDSHVDTEDPGAWEFMPPDDCSVKIAGTNKGGGLTLELTAHDYGSGMGPETRWPFRHGGLMQFSNDGETWSEVRPYSKNAIWFPKDDKRESIYARFRDRNGNWTEPISNE